MVVHCNKLAPSYIILLHYIYIYIYISEKYSFVVTYFKIFLVVCNFECELPPPALSFIGIEFVKFVTWEIKIMGKSWEKFVTWEIIFY